MERRLAAVVAADVPGYSAMMGSDERETIRRLTELTSLMELRFTAQGGRIFSRAGDGFHSEFSSPVSAVRAAFELQQELATPEVAHKIGLELRIGIHLADVVTDGDDLLGDGVNIASRIESACAPGSVLVTGTIFECVKRTAQLKFELEGDKSFKNISDPITIYRVLGELGSHSCATALFDDSHVPDPYDQTCQPNSVVVVPFKNVSNDPDQDYFADGFTEDLITELSRFPDIFTISRNASFGLIGKDVDAKKLGKTLGVQYCLEGGIRKLGGRVRINAYLVNAVNGEQIWSEKSDCEIDQLFDVQDDLISKIVSSVAGQIERQVEASAKRKRPNDLEAYECVLRGMEFHRIGGVSQQNAQEALNWFDQALQRDPQFGRAHAWRACALSTLSEWTGEDVWQELLEEGRLAVELDETDAESHRIVGSLRLYVKDFDKALYHFERALELNPNHAYIVGRMGEVYNFLGDGKKALEYQRRAKILDPFLPAYCRELEAVAYYVLGDYQECYNVVGEFSQITRRAAAYRAAAAVRLAEPEKVTRAAQELLLTDPKFDPAAFVLTEFFKDRTTVKQLKSDLADAVSAVSLRLAS